MGSRQALAMVRNQPGAARSRKPRLPRLLCSIRIGRCFGPRSRWNRPMQDLILEGKLGFDGGMRGIAQFRKAPGPERGDDERSDSAEDYGRNRDEPRGG